MQPQALAVVTQGMLHCTVFVDLTRPIQFNALRCTIQRCCRGGGETSATPAPIPVVRPQPTRAQDWLCTRSFESTVFLSARYSACYKSSCYSERRYDSDNQGSSFR